MEFIWFPALVFSSSSTSGASVYRVFFGRCTLKGLAASTPKIYSPNCPPYFPLVPPARSYQTKPASPNIQPRKRLLPSRPSHHYHIYSLSGTRLSSSDQLRFSHLVMQTPYKQPSTLSIPNTKTPNQYN